MSQNAIISKESTFVTFSHTLKALVAKFNLALKYVKINPGFSLVGRHGSSTSSSLRESAYKIYFAIGAGYHLNNELESDASYQGSSKSAHWFLKRRVLSVYTIFGHDSHLDNVTSIMI